MVKRKLIITADDFGAADGINRGIIEAYKNGVVTSSSVIIEKGKTDDAILFAKENPGLGIGLHLNLDSFCIIKRPDGVVEGFKENPLPMDELLTEARRQMGAFRKKGLNLYHIDSHHNAHLRPELFPFIVELCVEEGIKTIRFSALYYKKYFNGCYIENFRQILKDKGVLTTDHFINGWEEGCLDSFKEGSAELMTHPGYPDEGVTYPDWREKELHSCLDSNTRKEIEDKGIELITFKDLIA